MANFILSYDLNGPRPSHEEMDKHLSALGAAFVKARILETVWYVAGPTDCVALREYVQRILSPNDQLLIVEAIGAAWSNLLVDDSAFQQAFNSRARALAA